MVSKVVRHRKLLAAVIALEWSLDEVRLCVTFKVAWLGKAPATLSAWVDGDAGMRQHVTLQCADADEQLATLGATLCLGCLYGDSSSGSSICGLELCEVNCSAGVGGTSDCTGDNAGGNDASRLPHMCLHMAFECERLREFLIADIARERSAACMCRHVVVEVVCHRKLLRALRTLVWTLATVSPHVPCQIIRLVVLLAAVAAREWAGAAVHDHVSLECALMHEHLAALEAVVEPVAVVQVAQVWLRCGCLAQTHCYQYYQSWID